MQSKDVLNRLIIFLCLLTTALLFGCKAERAHAPAPVPQPRAAIELPTEFSQTLQLAFQGNAALTAERFIRAYDGLAKYGPVTPQLLKDHARLDRAAQQARTLSDILAIDLNGDRRISRAEFEGLTRLPNGTKKALRLAGLFAFDKDQDGHISLLEAIKCAENLDAAWAQTDMRPLESYLMLFDIDGDEKVMRGEVVMALGAHLDAAERAGTKLAGVDGALR